MRVRIRSVKAPTRLALTAACAFLAAATVLAPGCSRKRSDERRARSGPVTKVEVSGGRPERGRRPRPAANTETIGTAPITADDPCATRMHDLCGPLLLYYSLHRRLPERLETLQAGADATLATACPVSGGEYVYVPQGLPRGGGQSGFIVVHDPEPSHSAYRWAIVVDEPAPGGQQPLITRVVAIPESRFVELGRLRELGENLENPQEP